METDPRRWITALSASHTRLRTLVESLSPADLLAPSYDREWTVAQVLSHLGSQAEIFQLFLDAALSGRPVPGNEAFPPVWEVWNQRQPEEQSRECLDANDAFVARLEGLPDETLRRPITVFGMNVTIGDLARMRLSEHAVHSWDIAVSFDPTAQVAADAVALLIDTLTQLVAYAGKPQGRVFDVHIHTSAPERDFLLAVHDTVELNAFANQAVTGTLDLPAEALLRLVYGRLDPAHTPPVALAAGDVTLDDLRPAFPGL